MKPRISMITLGVKGLNKSIDFYDYLLTGIKPNDEKLQLDDVIFIPKRQKTISIKGEINRPGIYELKPDETLSDLLKDNEIQKQILT